ncbi:MAG: hypothetical protein J07HQW2_01241 [Haloquadratum walsbyi J07HQW2]|uniref:Uncharacterized protein n=1 Tax=Haloquadratum walsbyi J07HQW2 TaxID=1238425 RepID=U1MWI4_9EURY|nr:MAG: hypothetical protein J07HQW2_01241 [Haloquadratum walsbyi J07HQW2]
MTTERGGKYTTERLLTLHTVTLIRYLALASMVELNYLIIILSGVHWGVFPAVQV